jgi:hypothetical protein
MAVRKGNQIIKLLNPDKEISLPLMAVVSESVNEPVICTLFPHPSRDILLIAILPLMAMVSCVCTNVLPDMAILDS